MKDSKFIPGIYNYCDRWCERCRFTSRCRVFVSEQRSRQRLVSKGIDPDSPEGIEESLKESIEKSLRLLHAMSEEQHGDFSYRGSDVEKEEEERREEVKKHPLYKTAMEYADAAGCFLRRARSAIEEETSYLEEAMHIIRDKKKIDTLGEIRDAYDVVRWDQYLIGAKVSRALGSKYEAFKRDNKLLRDSAESDSNGSAKLAYLCVIRSMDSIRRIIEWDKSLSDEAITLLVLLKRLRNGIDAEIPGHHDFKRPGFDGPDAEMLFEEVDDGNYEFIDEDGCFYDEYDEDEGCFLCDEFECAPRKRLRDLLPSDLLLPPDTELSDYEIEEILERLSHILAQYRIGFSMNPGVPPRLIYKHIVEDILDEDVPFVSSGGYYLDGCDGSCPHCFQRPWCDTGQELDWDEDELEDGEQM